MMRRSHILAIALCPSLLLGCAGGAGARSSSSPMCGVSFKERVSFSDLNISLYSDQHGSYVTLAQCPERAFAVDYSQTEISRDENSKIARQMRINAAFGGAPVNMTVAGFYEPAQGPEQRAKIVIERIVHYVEQSNPHDPAK